MKANELMIGDWIDVRGIYVRVSKLDDMDNFKARYGCAELQLTSDTLLPDCINPIPLTEGILIANGFISLNYDTCFVYRCNELEQDFEITKDKQGYHLRAVVIAKIQYAHELQHALRLCGLNDLAYNFKIK